MSVMDGVAWFYRPDMGLQFHPNKLAAKGVPDHRLQEVVAFTSGPNLVAAVAPFITAHLVENNEFMEWAVTALDAAVWMQLGQVRPLTWSDRSRFMGAVPDRIQAYFLNRPPEADRGSYELMVAAASNLGTDIACRSYIATFMYLF